MYDLNAQRRVGDRIILSLLWLHLPLTAAVGVLNHTSWAVRATRQGAEQSGAMMHRAIAAIGAIQSPSPRSAASSA